MAAKYFVLTWIKPYFSAVYTVLHAEGLLKIKSLSIKYQDWFNISAIGNSGKMFSKRGFYTLSLGTYGHTLYTQTIY
jgi:hypothetical protein